MIWLITIITITNTSIVMRVNSESTTIHLDASKEASFIFYKAYSGITQHHSSSLYSHSWEGYCGELLLVDFLGGYITKDMGTK